MNSLVIYQKSMILDTSIVQLYSIDIQVKMSVTEKLSKLSGIYIVPVTRWKVKSLLVRDLPCSSFSFLMLDFCI